MTSPCNYFMLIWFLVLNIQDYRNTHLCEKWCIHHCIHTQTQSTLNFQSWNYNLRIRTCDVLSYILKYMYCMCLLLSPECSFFSFLLLLVPFFNPLIPESDKHLLVISPLNITPESNIKVMRIKEMIIN